MRDLFPGYYPLSENDIKDIWEKGLFVFDTNVLLSFYRYPIAVREDFFQVLQEISDRVWIPYQVALEFQRNRLNVISKQLKCFDDVRDALDKARKTLSTSFNDLQLKKRHSVINPDYLLSELDELFGGFRGDLLAKEQDQPNFDNDDVRAQLDNIFQGRVGDIPSKEWLESLYNEGKERYKSKTPPGYRDEEKSGKDSVSQFMHRQLVFKREFGDLILWRQITDKASSDNVSGIIFVCDDQKDDWWHSINFRGSKILGPHPELVEEFFLRTNSTSFWIYTSERFLRFARDYLKINVEQESIEQVREIVDLDTHRSQYAIFSPDLRIDTNIIEKFRSDTSDMAFLDLVVAHEDEFAAALDILNEMTAHTNTVGANIQKRAEALNKLNKEKNTENLRLYSRDVKKIVDGGAQDMDEFVARINPIIPSFLERYEQGISCLALAVFLIKDESEREAVEKVLLAIDGFVNNVSVSEEAIAKFRVSVINLPEITSKVKSSKRKMIESLDSLLDVFAKVKLMATEAHSFLENN